MAYSIDLRNKVLDAVSNAEGSYRDLAKRFNVSLTFIFSLTKLFRKTGDVKPGHGGGRQSIVDKNGYEFIRELVLAKPDITIQELCNKFEDSKKTKISIPTMGRILQKLNLNRKKKISMRVNK
jgi:transposase